MFYFPFKNNFFLRETRDGLGAFSGADLSRARFLTRSSKTLDREHRWNNAGLQKARVEWGKKWKEKRLRLRTPHWSGPSEISLRAWFSPEEEKQLYTATRQRVKQPERKDFNWDQRHAAQEEQERQESHHERSGFIRVHPPAPPFERAAASPAQRDESSRRCLQNFVLRPYVIGPPPSLA